jgi:formate dehydrogenase subunit delta
MSTPNLVQMANRIGEFFQAQPDRAEALAGIANHIEKFWAPAMRADMAQHLAQHQGEGLLPVVKEALQAHAQALHVKAPAA